MEELEMVGYSNEYLKSEGFDLIDSSIKERFRKSLEDIFGNAEIDPLGIVYRLSKNKPYEAFIRVFVNTRCLCYSDMKNLHGSYPQSYIDATNLDKTTSRLKLSIVIARCWIE